MQRTYTVTDIQTPDWPLDFPVGMKSSQEKQLLLVANAHMHWDPEFSDVKLIQTMMFLSELKSIAERASSSMASDSPTSEPGVIPIVLCADLNSLPDSGMLWLLSRLHKCLSWNVCTGWANHYINIPEKGYTQCKTLAPCGLTVLGLHLKQIHCVLVALVKYNTGIK